MGRTHSVEQLELHIKFIDTFQSKLQGTVRRLEAVELSRVLDHGKVSKIVNFLEFSACFLRAQVHAILDLFLFLLSLLLFSAAFLRYGL